MSAAPAPGGAGVQIEHKKGEVNELKTSLRNPAIDRDPEKKREVIKRVIAYMTLGIDVSKLFSEMVMVSAPDPTRSQRLGVAQHIHLRQRAAPAWSYEALALSRRLDSPCAIVPSSLL